MKTKKTLTALILPLALVALFIGGCSKNSSITGPNGNGQVNFQITQKAGNFGGTEFLFNPQSDVRVSKIISKLPAQQFADTISFTNTNYLYSKDSTYIINEFTGVENGQQWNFNFTGPSGNNSNYNVTVNYTVQ